VQFNILKYINESGAVWTQIASSPGWSDRFKSEKYMELPIIIIDMYEKGYFDLPPKYNDFRNMLAKYKHSNAMNHNIVTEKLTKLFNKGIEILISASGISCLSKFEDTIEEREMSKARVPTSNSVNLHSNFASNKDIFIAHRFAEGALIEKLKAAIEKAGYNWKEGKREDLGSISEDILSKIRSCGFFVSVMTKNDKLDKGGYTTSSWLIEEKGAALAFGHRPLIMVEEDVDRHYVGFLQSDDEMIYFNRNNFESKIDNAIAKIDNTFRKYNK